MNHIGKRSSCRVPTDTKLWEAVKNDDSTSAFSNLFSRYWSTIYTTSFSYLKNAEQSEEITHDIFLNLWRRRHALEIRSFPAYLRAAARYHVYKRMKAERTVPVQYNADWDKFEAPSVMNEGDERIRRSELESHVDQILLDLPARCQEIFLLSRRDQLTNDEISDRLGISKRSVENQLTRALKHLRNHAKSLTVCAILFFTFLLS